MQLALLGVDETVWQLANAVASKSADEATHRIICAYGAGPFCDPLDELGVELHSIDDWEELLFEPRCDAIVVGRGGRAALLPEQLRRLIQAASPIMVSHPIADMLLGFELQMIRQDTGGIVIPFFTGSEHPIWDELRSWVEQENRSPIGVIEQFEWERSLEDRTRPSVEAAFAKDAALQRALIGPIQRLGAMLSGRIPANKTDDWSQLSAHMDNNEGILARWAVRPATSGPSRLHIIGERGTATAILGDDPDTWTLSVGEGSSALAHATPWKGAAAVIDRLDTALNDRSSDTDCFDNACRAVELSDVLVTSCRRGRTIELHHEELTEEGTFKSLMAAGGCLALVSTFLVTLLMVVISPFGPSSSSRSGAVTTPANAHWLWKLLLVGLLTFLALQFLRLLFHKPQTTDSSVLTRSDLPSQSE